MVQVLQPLEKWDGNTTGVYVQIGNDEYIPVDQNFISCWRGRSISSFGHNLEKEKKKVKLWFNFFVETNVAEKLKNQKMIRNRRMGSEKKLKKMKKTQVSVTHSSIISVCAHDIKILQETNFKKTLHRSSVNLKKNFFMPDFIIDWYQLVSATIDFAIP